MPVLLSYAASRRVTVYQFDCTIIFVRMSALYIVNNLKFYPKASRASVSDKTYLYHENETLLLSVGNVFVCFNFQQRVCASCKECCL